MSEPRCPLCGSEPTQVGKWGNDQRCRDQNPTMSCGLFTKHWPAVQALKDELERLDSWYGLMSLLDKRWPEDIFPTLPDDESRDAGPRIVSLIRWVDQLKDELERCKARLDEIDAGAQADEDDLKKMRDGTKLTRSGVVQIIVYQQQDIRELKARIAELVQENVEDRRSAQHEHDRLKAELAAAMKAIEHAAFGILDSQKGLTDKERIQKAFDCLEAALTQAEPRPTPGAGDDELKWRRSIDVTSRRHSTVNEIVNYLRGRRVSVSPDDWTTLDGIIKECFAALGVELGGN